MVIRRIRPITLARVQALMFVVFGFFGSVMSLTRLSVSQTGTKLQPVTVLILLIMLPLVYGVLGFIGGMLEALVYNLFAKRFGGVELETE